MPWESAAPIYACTAWKVRAATSSWAAPCRCGTVIAPPPSFLLLRFFDQIRFYPVSADELLRMREDFPYGRHPLRIEESTLDLADYLDFLERERASIDTFRDRQRAAFAAERERWRDAGLSEAPVMEQPARSAAPELPDDCVAVTSPVSGSVWQVRVEAGQRVEKGDALVIMEAMKMEIAVVAETSGTVVSIHGSAGSGARAGDLLLALRPVTP
jgi:urea carboxylase